MIRHMGLEAGGRGLFQGFRDWAKPQKLWSQKSVTWQRCEPGSSGMQV